MSRKRKLSDSIKKIIAHKQNYNCYKCKIILPSTYQVDHIIPHSISNDDSEENLQALCPNCHSIKTQRENIRIIKFKSLMFMCPTNISLCWFCLEKYDDINHHSKYCSKILKEIKNVYEQKKSSSFDKMLYDHVHIDSIKSSCVNSDTIADVTTEFSKVKLSDDVSNILFIEIRLDNLSICINKKYVHKIYSDDITISDIADAVFNATRSKKYSKKIDTIEILLTDYVNDLDEKDKNDCYDYLSDILLDNITGRILKNYSETFIIIN